MKPLRAWFNIALFVTFFGNVFSENPNCPGLSQMGSSMYEHVFATGKTCVEMGATPTTAIELQQAKHIDDYRKFFRGYCQRQSIVRQCLEMTTKVYELCQNETYVNAFMVYRGFLETLLDIECTGEPTRLPKFWLGLHNLIANQTQTRELTPCFFRSLGLVQDMEGSNIDIASKLFIFYKEMQWFKICVQHKNLSPEFKDVVNIFLGEIINRMKCLERQDGTLQLCATIDPSLIRETNACGLITSNDKSLTYEELENEAGKCFGYMFDYDQLPGIGEVDMELLDNVPICFYKNIYECVDHLTIYSEMCFDQKQKQEFSILLDSIKTSFGLDCSNEGNRMKIVFNEMYRLKRNGYGDVILDCVDVIKSTRNVTDGHSSSKNMRFYHEMEALKTCLVNKLHGNQTSVDAAASLIDEMLASVKCVHPDDGTTVLCKSLMNTAHPV